MRYYQLFSDMQRVDYRFLGLPKHPDGKFVDTRLLLKGKKAIYRQPIIFPVQRKGIIPNLVIALYFPVADHETAKLIHDYAPGDIQIIHACSEQGDKVSIINILNVIDCLDIAKSYIEYFPEDYFDKKRVGKPRNIRNMTIDSSRVNGKNIFRIKDWAGPVIVSEEFADFLSARDLIGYELISQVLT